MISPVAVLNCLILGAETLVMCSPRPSSTMPGGIQGSAGTTQWAQEHDIRMADHQGQSKDKEMLKTGDGRPESRIAAYPHSPYSGKLTPESASEREPKSPG